MTTATKTKFIDQIESLPPLPTIVQRILAVTESPDSSADDVAKVLSGDPAVAAKVLRVANSPFYGMSRQVTQVSRAVVMLGSVAVRNLVLGICARDALASPGSHVPEHATLWRHSIAVGSASELIARELGLKPSEEAFVAGLLHDIGQLAMATFQPETLRTVFQEQGRGVRFLTLERQHFGIDHTEAGCKILTQWGLPEALCRVVRQHHQQEIRPDDPQARLLAVVILADTFAHMLGIGFDLPVGRFRRAVVSAELLGLCESDQFRILERLERRVDEATEMFAGADAANNKPAASTSKRAIWISRKDVSSRHISQLLLEHHGYAVTCIAPDDVERDLAPDDLVVVDLPPQEQANATQIALGLARQGHRRIVILIDPIETEAPRQCDPNTGVCHIPRLFTAFDLKWIEEQLLP